MPNPLRRALAILILLAGGGYAVAQQRCACVSMTASPLANTFFGMTQTLIGGAHNPTVNFYVSRMWDSDCTWNFTNTSSGVEDFTNCDAKMDQAQSAGATVSFVMGRTPSWAIAGGSGACAGGYAPNGCNAPPSDIGSGDTILKTFITDLVTHVKARYPTMQWYLECVNEADLTQTWSGSMSQLVTYCTDMKTTAQAIDATIVVMSPSFSTYNQFGPHLLPGYMAIAGAAASFDVVNGHPYFTCVASPCTVPETAIAANVQLTSFMAAHGLSTKPVIMSEVDWGGTTANGGMTDDQRIAWTGRFAMYTYNSGFAGDWHYQWECPSGVLSNCFGTMSGSGVGSAVATAFGTLQTWLIGSRHVVNGCNNNADGHGTWSCPIVRTGNVAAAVLFNSSGNQTVTVASNFTTQFNLDGTSSAIVANAVTAGLKPILVQ